MKTKMNEAPQPAERVRKRPERGAFDWGSREYQAFLADLADQNKGHATPEPAPAAVQPPERVTVLPPPLPVPPTRNVQPPAEAITADAAATATPRARPTDGEGRKAKAKAAKPKKRRRFFTLGRVSLLALWTAVSGTALFDTANDGKYIMRPALDALEEAMPSKAQLPEELVEAIASRRQALVKALNIIWQNNPNELGFAKNSPEAFSEQARYTTVYTIAKKLAPIAKVGEPEANKILNTLIGLMSDIQTLEVLQGQSQLTLENRRQIYLKDAKEIYDLARADNRTTAQSQWWAMVSEAEATKTAATCDFPANETPDIKHCIIPLEKISDGFKIVVNFPRAIKGNTTHVLPYTFGTPEPTEDVIKRELLPRAAAALGAKP